MSTGTYGARTARSGGPNVNRPGRYQLCVTAQDAADVVSGAGGWLVDRAMAGWDVTVVLTEDGDPSPLRILGVNTRLREPDDASAPLCSQAIAVSGAALAEDATLRGDVVRAVKRGTAEVTVWGDLDDPVPGLVSVRHVLTSAARAFKTRALVAAGSAEAAQPFETFTNRTPGLLATYSDLTLVVVATSLAQR